MATVVLSTAGAVLGSAFGPLGTMLGRAAGGLVGSALDQRLFGGGEDVVGPRLGSVPIATAEEGAPIPRAYGTVRTGGHLIWATRFEEEASEERQGGKGRGPTVTSFAYFANAAYALCEGPISGVRRVWADGREIDLAEIEMRVYRGTHDQLPDPLIEAKQGGAVPAFRGTAYVVVERLALERFGNRLPQLTFEVLRGVNSVAARTRAITLIPGATEFGYEPAPLAETLQPGETRTVNRHVLHGPSDWTAAIDELQALCPALEAVSLVVAWFGDDLDAARCRIVPGVESGERGRMERGWRVAGRSRAGARLVSRPTGSAAFGSTPDDASVVNAIRDLRARNLKVFLYPFVLMDVPPGNGLPDPYGASEQGAYPWRGRITCSPAPGRAGSPDASAAIRPAVAAFVGGAGRPNYAAFIDHYARLCAAAGGVDGFVIGSEMRGLTALRDDADRFPFVEALRTIATDARAALGPDCAITYAADWTEYSGHRPDDGSGDLFRHLDPLWSDPAIDAVGIDNYLPLADIRDDDAEDGGADGAASPYDRAMLARQIEGGELFDWFYATPLDRKERRRTPITDGANGKPWAYRIKDIASWWANSHHDRRGGVESAATSWVPRSKPIWFTELGAPAVDKAANQPNVFPDPKSAENAVPHFSSGARDDLAQHAFLDAHLAHWEDRSIGEPDMVDPSRIFLWTWDARPVPAFPLQRDVWADGTNWATGHWLNGRFSGAPLGEMIEAVLADHGIGPASGVPVDATRVEGWAEGLLLADPASARASLAAVLDRHGIVIGEREGALVLASDHRPRLPVRTLPAPAAPEGAPEVVRRRAPVSEAPGEVVLAYRDPFRDHGTATAHRRVPAGPLGARATLATPLALSSREADRAAERLLRASWDARESIEIALPWSAIALDTGDTIEIDAARGRRFTIERIEDGETRRLSLRALPTPVQSTTPVSDDLPPTPPTQPIVGAPRLAALDLPLLPNGRGGEFLAAWSRPWQAQASFRRSPSGALVSLGVIGSPARMGTLVEPLGPGPVGPRDDAGRILVRMASGSLQSVPRMDLLAGANAAAIACGSGWEIVQYERAEEVEPSVWLLSGLLRARLATDRAMETGATAGAQFVVLDDALLPVDGRVDEATEWIAGPSGATFDAARFASVRAELGRRQHVVPSPVHLRARERPDGSLDISWVRRGRVDAETWHGDDIPLGEERERYRVRLMAADMANGGSPLGGSTVAIETEEPRLLYDAATRVANGHASVPLIVAVAQIGTTLGEGDAATLRLG